MPAPDPGEPLVLAAPDKFRGTLSASGVAAGLGRVVSRSGWAFDACPLSDGGEGFAEVLSVLGGEERATRVTGPLGDPVVARWRLALPLAVLESAAASGLALVGGAEANRPLEATTRGTGELVLAAVSAGAERMLLGVGGSATTDGGRGAVEAIVTAGGLGHAQLVVACDVDITFVDAAERFGPQKGAGPTEVKVLRRRLETLAEDYRSRYGVDVAALPGAGAAGGLAGGLAAVGARLVPGFELVADAVGLEGRMRRARLVLTGEGRLDAASWTGKVVGGVVAMAARVGVPVVVVAGVADEAGVAGATARGVRVVSLAGRYGLDRSLSQTAACLEDAAGSVLSDAARR